MTHSTERDPGGQTQVIGDQSAAVPPASEPPVVDPSPTAPPIALNNQSLKELLEAHPARASDQRTLDLEPNRYEDATVGPDEQISQTLYVEMTKPDGTTFLSPRSNVPYYASKGYTEGAEQDIPDLVAYWAEQAGGPHMEERVQTPEEVLNRMAGVPKTAEEIEAERAALEEERKQKLLVEGAPPVGTQPSQPTEPAPTEPGYPSEPNTTEPTPTP